MHIKTMNVVSKTRNCALNNDRLCMKTEEFCTENDEFCIENDEFAGLRGRPSADRHGQRGVRSGYKSEMRGLHTASVGHVRSTIEPGIVW